MLFSYQVFRRMRISFALFALVLSVLADLAVAVSAEEINPPFGLQWGETPEHIEKLLKGAKAVVVDRHPIQDREAWTVEGLIQADLRRTIFYFRSGQLSEVELQYQSDEWDTNKYNDFMSQVRQRIEKRYGAGQLVARSKTPDGDVMQTVVGYKWNQNNTSIQLIYFSAENANQIYRTVSVHYKSY
ncbi:MAG: hypothetical protein M3O82_06005 [Verrucomicrobiota bacterium]|nr:hypothetical protein [Verrucomicrobiota bacterium]